MHLPNRAAYSGVMTKDEARAALRRAAAARRRAEAALDRAREETLSALIAAHDAEVRPTDLVADSGYDREHVRRLIRAEEKARAEAEPSAESH
jgi:hypothetical protein